MPLSLSEKEDRIKSIIGKKIRVFQITPQGQITFLETVLKDYHRYESAGMILSLYEVENEGVGTVNADLLKVFNEEKKEWEDLW
jgi:hypothetical protein